MILRVTLAWLSELPCLSDVCPLPGLMYSYSSPKIIRPVARLA